MFLAALCFVSYFTFGYYSRSYDKLGVAFNTSFHKLLIESNHYELAEINKFMSIVILLVLAIIMVFVLLTLLNVIIMSNYSLLKRSTQMKIEAAARMTREEGKNWTRKILNLVLCRSPVEREKSEEDVPQTEEKDVLQEAKKKKKTEKELSVWNIFLMNLNALCVFQAHTSESRKKKQKETIDALKQEQHAARMEEKREQERNVITRLVQAVIYITFLVLFITLTLLHINVGQLSLANNAMKVLIPSTEYSKTYIQDSDMQKSVNLVVEKVYAKQIKDSGTQTQDYFLDNAVFFSNPFLRVIYKRNMVYKNGDTDVNRACPFKTVDSTYSSNENAQDWEVFVYAGNDKLHGKDSGVVINFPYKVTFTNQEGLNLLGIDQIMSKMTVDKAQLVMEIFGYIPNIETFTRVKVEFKYQSSGIVAYNIYHYAVLYNQYSSKAAKARAALEIIICLFVLYFTFEEICSFIDTFQEVRAKDHLDCPKPGPDDTCGDRVLIALYTDPKTVKNKSLIELIFYFLLGVLKLIYHVSKQIVLATVKYLFRDISGIIRILSIVLCYIVICNW